jgi:hypothetical protein
VINKFCIYFLVIINSEDIFGNLGFKQAKIDFFYRFLNFFDEILYEIQYLTAYISGNMHPIEKSQIDSNNSYLKLLFFIYKFL